MNIVDPDGSQTNELCKNFFSDSPTEFPTEAEFIVFNDAALLYDINNRGKIYDVLTGNNGANLGTMPSLPDGDPASWTIWNRFSHDLCWQWQKDHILASQHPQSPIHYNGFSLVNSAKDPEVNLKKLLLDQVPGYEKLPEYEQNLMLAEWMDEIGECRSSISRPGDPINSMCSAIKKWLHLPGVDSSLVSAQLSNDLSWLHRTTKNESTLVPNVVTTFFNLQLNWEKTGQGASPLLLMGLHLKYSRGDIPNVNSPREFLLDLYGYAKTALDAAFLPRPQHFDVKFPQNEMIKAIKGFELILSKNPLSQIVTMPEFLKVRAAKENQYNEELQNNPWVKAEATDSLRRDGKELNEKNLRVRIGEIVAQLMPDYANKFIEHVEGIIYRAPIGIPYTPFTAGALYGTLKGLATGDEHLVLSSLPGVNEAYYLGLYQQTGNPDYIVAITPVLRRLDDVKVSWRAGNYDHAFLSLLGGRGEAKPLVKITARVHQAAASGKQHLRINKEMFRQFPQLASARMQNMFALSSILAGADPLKVKAEITKQLAKLDPYDLTRSKGTNNRFAISGGDPTTNMPFERDGQLYVNVDGQSTPVVWDKEVGRYRIDEANSDSHLEMVNGQWARCRSLRGPFSSCLGRRPRPDNLDPANYISRKDPRPEWGVLPGQRLVARPSVPKTTYIKLEYRSGWFEVKQIQLHTKGIPSPWVTIPNLPGTQWSWVLKQRTDSTIDKNTGSQVWQWYPAHLVNLQEPHAALDFRYFIPKELGWKADAAGKQQFVTDEKGHTCVFVALPDGGRWFRAVRRDGDWMIPPNPDAPNIATYAPHMVLSYDPDAKVWKPEYRATYADERLAPLNSERYSFRENAFEEWSPAEIKEGFINPDFFYVLMNVGNTEEHWYRGVRLGPHGGEMVIPPKDPAIGKPLFIQKGYGGRYYPVQAARQPFDKRRYQAIGPVPLEYYLGMPKGNEWIRYNHQSSNRIKYSYKTGVFTTDDGKKAVKLKGDDSQLYKIHYDPNNHVRRLVADDPSDRKWPIKAVMVRDPQGNLGRTGEWIPHDQYTLVSIIDDLNSGIVSKSDPQQGGTTLRQNDQVSIKNLRERRHRTETLIKAHHKVFRATLFSNLKDSGVTPAESLWSGPDDYLRRFFIHSAAKYGSEGRALSFTPDWNIAAGFYDDLPEGNRAIVHVKVTDSDLETGKVKSAAGFLLDEAEKLMRLHANSFSKDNEGSVEKRPVMKVGISPETVKAMLHFIYQANENEVSFQDGYVPPEKILKITDGLGNEITPIKAAKDLSKPGFWNAFARALAPRAVAEILQRPIKIYNPEGSVSLTPKKFAGSPINIHHFGGNRYKVEVGGNMIDAGDDGDSFLRAVVLGNNLGKEGPDSQLLDQQIANLRRELVNEISLNSVRYTKAYVEFLHPNQKIER
ncbi:hypothetical protein, partial [Brucella intermedia]|uniref:hypothetical protein n=1 Tax=Brucella intermedia TaxID=94625 RepID=UPI00235DF403